MRATKNIEWEEFRKTLLRIGYNAQINVPIGSVVSFDESGNAFLVASNLHFPSQYIDAVKNKIQ